MPKIRAHFSIKSPSVDLPELTSMVGLTPTEGRSLSDRRSGSTGSTGWYACWRISTGEAEEVPDRDLAAHVAELLGVIEPTAARWVGKPELRDTLVTLSCVAYIPDATMPALFFDGPLLTRISRLGAALDVDLYPMWPTSHD
jgi:hypothetical protein